MSTSLIANNAYQTAANLAKQQMNGESPAKTEGADFGGMVQEAVGTVVDKGRQTDQMAMGMVEGKTGVVDVVTAIAETEVALETMVTVRDKVISAYQEIMRMPI